jgi:hypothetical protein
VIVKRGRNWVVTTESGRVLGTHKTEAEAKAQLAAVEISKHRRNAEMNKKIRGR